MRIIFLGPQGSGKSTQAKMLASYLTIPYIEMGQIFRDKANDGDELAIKIKKSLDSGVLVDDDIAVKTLQDELAKDKYRTGFILDGYPRNQKQQEGLKEHIDEVFYVRVSDKEAIKRLMLRAREDDTEQLLAKRLEIYHQKTEPLLDNFKKLGILKEINGEVPIEKVHLQVIKLHQSNAEK